MKKLLAENGTIYVHTDWHVGHYIKIIMDEIFGKENFMNEIIWHYRTGNIATKFFRRAHDVILVYKKGENPTFNPIEVKEYYWQIYGPRFKPSFKGRKHGKDELGEYRISFVDDVWDISAVFTLGSEHLPFPTQKPEKLLERIIKASSNEGDLIADFFCGSGTTLAVAEKLGRRWIGCDLSKYAIHITRKRLLDIPGCRPFKVLNLGMYQKHKLMENGIENYIDFILKIYGATRISGYSYLHGRKGRRLIHVATPDSFVTEREVRRALEECRSANSTGLDVLGWEFEMGLHELIDEIARDYGVDIRLKLIPTDILDIRQKDVTDIKFFDLNL
jgi:SAM-dependent methyltransferase